MTADAKKELNHDEVWSSLSGTDASINTMEQIMFTWDFGEMDEDDVSNWLVKNCDLNVCPGCGYWVTCSLCDMDDYCEDCQESNEEDEE
jgi:hypothetical protein